MINKEKEEEKNKKTPAAESKSEGGDDIEKLKAEIIKEVSASKKNKKMLDWSSVAVTVVLGVLALISIGQTVQSATILQKINSGDLGPAKGASAAIPSNLESLPDMVGGC